MKNIFIIILVIPLSILRGWVLLTFWNWFILPLGAPHITLAHALGISIILNYLLDNISREGRYKDKDKIEIAFGLILEPLFILFLGWIVKSFM
jgi:hypothetical protein